MIEWLSQYSGSIVLVSFFSAFAGITLWAFMPANKAGLERHAEIPLREVE
ncbi:MAG: cbb3-type cytochrome c oxidase subunit 3 [Alphaproteobacteria bacterium]|nr:cbb3-type cytochrome c oxidase subunit 3 [Alphaproteobacteria bacterium]